ncbi:MAG: helicase HerA-like domain-containing protein [Chthoniobacteraceae bacterium]
MSTPFLLAKGTIDVLFNPAMANRHGLVAGATGTGKTVTLQSMAEQFSALGVPVFMADVKGDLAGIAKPGGANPKIAERVRQLALADYTPAGFPVVFWDVFGENGHPIRATVSEMGPLLLSRLLNLNDTQEGVLAMTFKIADDNGLLLLDLKDLRALLQWIGDNASQLTTKYGNVSAASVGAIQRGLLALEQQGGDKFFGEPALNLDDFIQTDANGHGHINILAADRLMQNPRAYAAMLLWMLSELFERLPEVGDQPKPKLIFFFDEAHLLFTDIPSSLQEKIEQVVRLVRSKGVGIFFVSQNPLDIPDTILAQLGNRVQHALRAFTPRDQKAVKASAETFRPNPKLNTEQVITELGVGEALISLLDERGQPGIVERAFVVPPRSRLGPVTPDERRAIVQGSVIFGTYENAIDRESASEILAARAAQNAASAPPAPGATAVGTGVLGGLGSMFLGSTGPRGGVREGLIGKMASSAVRSIGSGLGREIIRGVLGGLFGGKRR